jgi:hypothetical protein
MSRTAALTLAAALLAAPAFAHAEPPATAPAAMQPVDTATLELRANEAFARSDWAAALPLLKQLAVRFKDDPARAAPILEKVRVAEANVPGAVQPGPDAKLNASRTPHGKPKAGEVVNFKSIKDLGNFDYDPDVGGGIPEDVKQLTGSTVRLRGFMIPLDQANKITRFALVPDLFACCFGQPPGIQHTIVVRCPAGKAVSYYPDELVIEGKLTVDEKHEDGFIVSVFEMEAASVKPAPQ